MTRLRHLDTSIVIDHLRGRANIGPGLVEFEGRIAISAPVLPELLFGVRRSSNPARDAQQLNRFLHGIPVAVFDAVYAGAYAGIHANLTARGQLIGEMDMLIAASVMAHDAALVTHNLSHFDRVAGLEIEDWQLDIGV